MLVVLGLYLMDAWRGLTRLEQLGQGVWRRLRPLMRLILPLDSPFKMFAMGALWGWLPCGMVYSVLITAMLSGSASSGAAVMTAFGLGTLPMLAVLGMAGSGLRGALQRASVRRIAGAVVIVFGLLGIARGQWPAAWLAGRAVRERGPGVSAVLAPVACYHCGLLKHQAAAGAS
ncbi:sulfite exporter TauE/SafE family protein [Massilia sp. B-10]|nr:sulfite exporter TauE/SafE family protein [Massilia sp. B-10]